MPNPHVPSGKRVGSEDETKPCLPPVLQYQKAEDSGNKAHQQMVCIHRLEKACSLASNLRLPPSDVEAGGGPGMNKARATACKHVGSGHHRFKYICTCVIHAYQFEISVQILLTFVL